MIMPAHDYTKAFGQTTERPEFVWVETLTRTHPHAELYLVGGAVRDTLLDINPVQDYDVVVRGVAARDLEAFLNAHGSVNLVGKSFGVFKFYARDHGLTEAIDIALPRTEHAWGTGGYKAVDVQSNPHLPIEEDLARRDFTINAMAWDIGRQTLIDPFNGVHDLETHTIRTVGAAHERFKEDYSRLLRALRFSCQFGWDIEPATWEALVATMPNLTYQQEDHPLVANEIIAKELLKAFWLNPVRAFDLYDSSGAFRTLMPEVESMKTGKHLPEHHSEGNVFAHTRLALASLSTPAFQSLFPDTRPSAQLLIGLLLHDIAKPVTFQEAIKHGKLVYQYYGHDQQGAAMASALCQRLKLSAMTREGPLHVDCDNVAWMIAHHLLLMNSDIPAMRASTVERYFFNDRLPGQDLLMLIVADTLATIPEATGVPPMDNIHAIFKRLNDVKKQTGAAVGTAIGSPLPPPLINGNDLIESLGLAPGKHIGSTLAAVREQQLQGKIHTKEEALKCARTMLET